MDTLLCRLNLEQPLERHNIIGHREITAERNAIWNVWHRRNLLSINVNQLILLWRKRKLILAFFRDYKNYF